MMITPLDKYDWISGFLKFFLKLCGSNFMDGPFWITPLAKFYMCLVCMGISSAVYTTITAEVGFAMQAVVFLCLASQGFVKFLAVNLNRKKLNTLHNYVRKVCAQNSVKQCSGYVILQEWLDIFVILTKYFSVVIFMAMIGIGSFPIVYFVLNGETTDILPLDLPFNDKTTSIGYFVLTLFQCAMVMIGGFGLIAADLLMGLFFLYIVPFCDLFKLRVTEINEQFKMDPKSAKSLEFKKYLRNIVETHTDLCRYLSALSRIYSPTFLIEVNADGVAMMFSVYVALVIKWYPIYVVFLMLFLKLLSTCLLGAIVKEMSERIDAAIYNINWPLLPIPLQKVILLMLMRAQNPTILTTGSIELNLNLFITVMKNIYTVGMLLLESVD